MSCYVERQYLNRMLGGQQCRSTLQVIINTESSNDHSYLPGDHVAIFPANREELVNAVIDRLQEIDDPDQPIQVLVQKEMHTANGIVKSWEPHDRLPEASVRTLLTRFLDITTTPTPNFLHFLAEHASNNDQKQKLQQLATDPHEYEEWKQFYYPHLKEVLEEFSSIALDAGLLLTKLHLLQPRFYSVSSSPIAHPEEIHITVAVVIYRTQGGKGPLHYGICSNYLKDIHPGDQVECFVRSAPGFHLPDDPSKPVILVGPGTGVAPFRSFWYHRLYSIKMKKEITGEMALFFGCRIRALDLYREEKEEMIREGVLTATHLALSREPAIPKTYVQDQLLKVGLEVYRQVVEEKGHFYVCGDCTMAECVYQRLKVIIQHHGNMSDQEVDNYMLQMRDENRYHEDIFGITLRTEEIHRQKRESAKNRIALISQNSICLSQD